jgi:UDP-3-O-[3-hydroxymyristoyl] glucosamine N-acyltransferase
MAATLAELARRVNGTVRGKSDTTIARVAPLAGAGPGDIAFLADRKYRKLLAGTRAGAVILREADLGDYAGNALVVADPHLAFAQIAALLHPAPTPAAGVHASAVVASGAQVAPTVSVGPRAVIEEGAVLGERVQVGPGCYVGRGATLGAGTRLVANVYIADGCVVGRDCLLHPGAVVGADGFGFARDGERWRKVPQLGRAVLGDEVEIGANTTVDRGALADTVIGNGVKLDNLVHVAHNVRIGDHTAVAAQVGIAGSTTIGQRCTVGGQAGIVDHLAIVDDVHITAGTLVTGSIEKPGVYSASLKAQPVEAWRRNAARLHRLDELARRVQALEKKTKEKKA